MALEQLDIYMQIKSRYHCTSIKMAKIQNTGKHQMLERKDVEQQELSFIQLIKVF